MKIDANLVRAEREKRGWTQQQLAEFADLSLRTVQRMENQAVASNESVSAIAAVLEVPRGQVLNQPVSVGARPGLVERNLGLLIGLAACLGAVFGAGSTVMIARYLGL